MLERAKRVACAGLFLALFFAPSTLARSPWPVNVQRIDKTLETGSTEQRKAAVAQLMYAPPEQSRAIISRHISDDDPELRVLLGELTVKLGYADMAASVRDWHKSSDPVERALAADLLSVEYDSEGVHLLGQLLADHVLEVRVKAISALGRAPEPFGREAANLILTTLGDVDPQARAAAAQALGILGQSFVTISLAGHMQDPDDQVRLGVARALGALGAVEAVPALLVALGDPDPAVVTAAARALLRCGDQKAVAGLLDLLDREAFREPQRAALEALLVLDPQAAQPPVDRLLRDARENGSLLNWARSSGGDRRLDVSRCLKGAVLSELRACAQIHIAQDGDPALLVPAVVEHRLSLVSALIILSARPKVASVEPSEETLVIRALEEVSLSGRRNSRNPSPADEPARSYLRTFVKLPAFAFEPLTRAVATSPVIPERIADLLHLIKRTGVRPDGDWLARYLSTEQPLVKTAAAELAARFAEDEPALERLLLSSEGEVARAAGNALSETMSSQQSEALIALASATKLAVDAPIKQAMAGVVGLLSKSGQKRLLALWEKEEGKDRSWLLPALVQGLTPDALGIVASSADWSERAQLAQLLITSKGAKSLIDEMLRDPNDWVVALAYEALGWLVEKAKPDDFVAPLRNRPAFVRAAGLRAMRRALSRGQLRPLGAASLPSEFCESSDSSLSAAAWGLAAEAGVPCGGRDVFHALLTHGKDGVRRAIAQGISVTTAKQEIDGAALRACATYDLVADIAQLCDETALRLLQTSPQKASPSIRTWRTLRLNVSWIPEAPRHFPYLVLIDERPQLVYSDGRGVTRIWAAEDWATEATPAY